MIRCLDCPGKARSSLTVFTSCAIVCLSRVRPHRYTANLFLSAGSGHALSECTAIARPSVSTFALTTVVLCVIQRLLSDTVLLPMPLASNRVILSGSAEKVSQTPYSLSSMRPGGFALWHDEWAGPIFRLRGFPSALGNLYPTMVTARRNRQSRRCALFLCPTGSSPNPLMFARTRKFPPASCQKRPPVSPPPQVSGSFKRRRWSELAIMPHTLPLSDLSASWIEGRQCRWIQAPAPRCAFRCCQRSLAMFCVQCNVLPHSVVGLHSCDRHGVWLLLPGCFEASVVQASASFWSTLLLKASRAAAGFQVSSCPSLCNDKYRGWPELVSSSCVSLRTL